MWNPKHSYLQFGADYRPAVQIVGDKQMIIISSGPLFANRLNRFANPSKGGFMKIERREFVRCQIPLDTIFLYSNNSPVKGWVKDISSGGMAFEYTQIEGCEPKPEISLILMGDAIPFYLPDLPCKTIYCTKMNNSGRLGRGLQKRRCGVQYEKLDPELQEKITNLLSNEVIIDNSK